MVFYWGLLGRDVWYLVHLITNTERERDISIACQMMSHGMELLWAASLDGLQCHLVWPRSAWMMVSSSVHLSRTHCTNLGNLWELMFTDLKIPKVGKPCSRRSEAVGQLRSRNKISRQPKQWVNSKIRTFWWTSWRSFALPLHPSENILEVTCYLWRQMQSNVWAKRQGLCHITRHDSCLQLWLREKSRLPVKSRS